MAAGCLPSCKPTRVLNLYSHAKGLSNANLQTLKITVLCGIDVLYDPTYHGALLSSLELLCAPHTLVYVAWKKRHKDEEGFLALAEARGFAVEQVGSCREDFCSWGQCVLFPLRKWIFSPGPHDKRGRAPSPSCLVDCLPSKC